MSVLTFRQMIDMAIGSPEPGHVNFLALHYLLLSFADKLDIADDKIDYKKYGSSSIFLGRGKSSSDIHLHRKLQKLTQFDTAKRLTGGTSHYELDPDGDAVPEEAAGEAATEAPDGQQQPVVGAESTTQQAPSPEAAPPPPDQQPVEEVKKQTSKTSASPEKGAVVAVSSPNANNIVANIEGHLSLMENAISTQMTSHEFQQGIAIMKDQLDLAMEQLHMLTNYVVDKQRSEPLRLEQLKSLSAKLRGIQRENIFITGAHQFQLDDDISVSWRESDFLEEEAAEEALEEAETQSKSSSKSSEPPAPIDRAAEDQYDLDLHLCYSPEKMLDQLLELKSEFCIMNNKVNEISAKILEQDCQRTTLILQELTEQMREVRYSLINIREGQERLESKHMRLSQLIDEINVAVEELKVNKVDTTELDILLADKVDYNQLQKKVSHEQLQQLQCRMEKQFCEVNKTFSNNERTFQKMLDNMRTSLGYESIQSVLNQFKEQIDQDIRKLRDTLQSYIEATDDECAAAGARMKVLQDLACLSCDTTCVMRTMEKAKVGKLPNARTSNMISPLITYELGTIRKSGIMGYFRKDEFPQGTNAWLNRQNMAAMKTCVPRHAGGPHTTHTAKEHVEKVLLSKR